MLTLLFAAAAVFADAPSVEHIFPAGFARGTTNAVTVAGKLGPWPPQVWVDCAGINFLAETNTGKFRVEVAADAPVGPHLARFHNDDGPSSLRLFIVTDQREALEIEPNDYVTNAQPAGPLPVTLNGQLNKSGDVDSFAVAMDAGQRLTAEVEAYTLASKMDALLRIVTTSGVQLTWNHDFVTLDPRLVWAAPSNSIYIVQVMGFKYPADSEVRLAGGEGCVYRLHLVTTTHAPTAVPDGVPEQEPNNTPAQANSVQLPATVAGCVGTAGDEDCFRFDVRKDEIIEASVAAASLGSAADTWLSLRDAQGKELARSDDTGDSRDPRLEWKAPTNGTFTATVGSIFQQGGDDHFYRLTLRPMHPDYRATLATTALRINIGESNELKIKIERLRGFDHKLTASLAGLPGSVSAAAVEVGEKAGEVVFKIDAKSEAKDWSGPVQVEITDASTGEKRFATSSLTASSENNGVPGGYTRLALETTSHLWLSIRAKAAEKPK